MSLTSPGSIVILLIALIALLILVISVVARSKAVIRRWAKNNGYTLVSLKYCFLLTGPYSSWAWWGFTPYTVWFASIEYKPGHERKAWIRCGKSFVGILSDHVDVVWVSPPPEHIGNDKHTL